MTILTILLMNIADFSIDVVNAVDVDNVFKKEIKLN